MKTTLHMATRCAGLALAAGWAGLIFTPSPAVAGTSSPTYDNYIDVSAGANSVDGSKASFQKLNNQNKDGRGGISGFHYSQDVSKNTTFTADGHAIGGDDDFKLNLKLSNDDVGYIAAGYTAFRTYYDGNGGYFPTSGYFAQLYDPSLHVDRTDLWVEAALTPPDKIHFDFRYDFTTRKGLKDSTEWGDTTATAGAGARAVVPTFLRIDEHRHIVNAKASFDGEQTSWEFVGHYETSKQNNDTEVHRTPGASTDRYVTQTNGQDNDLFMVRGFAESKIGETLSMSTGMAHYDLDTNIAGSRIYGSQYDPVFNPTYTNRQWHDEGFYNLNGGAHMQETLANVNFLYTPTENWSIVPSLLAEKTRWGATDSYVETSVGNGPSFAMAQDENEGESNEEYRELTGLLEMHYTGFKNVALNSNLEMTQGYGTLSEDLFAAETGLDTIYRTTNYRQGSQKYDFTAHWYAKPGLSFSAQYYWKGRQNSFNDTRDSVNPAPPSGDRYPGYITHQDYATNDANLRVSWAPFLNLHTVTRYDYQDTKIRTQEIGLAFIDSAVVRTNVVSETVTWNPVDRWYVQAAGSVVYDQTKTPASTLTGAATGIVLNSDNNYWDYELASGYALNNTTDVSASYTYYRANNYTNNAKYSVPYGADFTNQMFSLTWVQRVSANLNYTVKYSYGDYGDVTAGGFNNFRAHLVYAKVQYRF
ncbi:MAG TPA: hypothetical protein VHE61_12285 [Opitutaceae bacterium]|nr:hypothetical protein [Opitutaceae bacterium]